MKTVQLSPHIWRLGSWMVLPMNVWLVRSGDGLILIDGGIPTMAKGILRTMEQLKLPLKAILLTHGHSDHVGSVNEIVKQTSAPVYLYKDEIPYAEGELPYPGRKKAQKMLDKGLASPLPEDSEGHLQPWDSLIPIWTPGHSPGHVAYYHKEDGVLIGGDLFTTRKGRLARPIPMFTSDMKTAVRSGAVIKDLQPKLLSICHGSDISHPHLQWEGYWARWS
ncbi:MBL fold metallo-hydrolase [Paenibacillus sp. J2TS4]|uniref:MBL fold metallo-hydrolase n=1 Tax=Paenibacillus sp. J2TS4 TaxID=2807194 RepID=UPI001B1C983F|nr:MBL fold metallo-hydrolase [Paenibacillus sp. J2TS4]GIP36003.1 putative metallo-hydrolase YybB [Paenibacillus sp. J2TS4]